MVRNKKTGEIGVTSWQPFEGKLEDTVIVTYQSSVTPQDTDWHDLEIIGPENAIADKVKCGNCIFLVEQADDGSVQCHRFGLLRWKKLFAPEVVPKKKLPVAFFPGCQEEM